MHPAGRPPRARILVVEDESRLRGLLRLYLERAGYEVREAADGRAGLDAFDEDGADLLVVDLMLPRLQGEALIRAIREDSAVPILITSAKRSDVERIAGLRLGADDYLAKPYNVHELVERVNAILRRASPAGSMLGGGPGRRRGGAGAPLGPIALSERLSFAGGRLLYDPATREYVCGAERGRLTPTESRLLLALAHAAGAPLDRDRLLEACAGPHAETSRNVDVHVRNLRRKLGDDPAQPWAIETIPDVGYRWVAPREEDTSGAEHDAKAKTRPAPVDAGGRQVSPASVPRARR